MDENVDLLRSESKQPMGFDNFETFVHEGRGVDGDLRAHVPGRMPHRFGNGREFHFRLVLRAKRTTRGSENDSTYFFAPFTAQTLVQRGERREEVRRIILTAS